MKKLTRKDKENIKTGVIILMGIIIFVGAIFFISENTGNRSGDKDPNNATSTGQVSENPLLEEGEELNEEEQSELTSFTYENLKNALDNNEKKFIFLGSEYCGWCIYQKPILKSLVYKYNVEIDYLNVAEMTSNEGEKLESLHESLEGFGTPTFLVIENGKVTNVYEGARGTSGIKEILKNHSFISE